MEGATLRGMKLGSGEVRIFFSPAMYDIWAVSSSLKVGQASYE